MHAQHDGRYRVDGLVLTLEQLEELLRSSP